MNDQAVNYFTYFTLGVSLIGGGLAGAILNHFIQIYRRPRLDLSFDSQVPGCEVETGAVESPSSLKTRYLRVKIHNSGRSSAEKVAVSITRISFSPRAQPGARQNFGEEVLDLKLAMTEESVFRPCAGGSSLS
jgi:hypothetical protein